MAISKVVFGDKILLDLTEDTVTPDSVYEGYTFHSADGTLQVGARSAEGVVRYDVEQLLTDIQKAQARANIGASEAEHASTHAAYGSDPIDPISIGAALDSDVTALRIEMVDAINNHTHDYAAKSQAKTASLTAAGWDSSAKTQTVSVAGVTANSNIIVTPAPASYEAWGAAGIRATAQADGTVTFTCDTVPTEAIAAQILIVG